MTHINSLEAAFSDHDFRGQKGDGSCTPATHGPTFSKATTSHLRYFSQQQYQELNQLIRDIAKGKREAMAALFKMMEPWIEGTRGRIAAQELGNNEIGNEECAHDMSIDAFMVCCSKAEQVGFSTYSEFTVNFQVALRNRLRTVARERGEGFSLPVSAHIDPDEWVSQGELRYLIDDALKKLTPREEKILRMRFFENVTLEDIGQEISVSIERVRQIEAKAFRKLRRPECSYRIQEYLAEKRAISRGKSNLSEEEVQNRREQEELAVAESIFHEKQILRDHFFRVRRSYFNDLATRKDLKNKDMPMRKSLYALVDTDRLLVDEMAYALKNKQSITNIFGDASIKESLDWLEQLCDTWKNWNCSAEPC